MLSVLKRLYHYTKTNRKDLFGMLIFALFGTVLSLLIPIFIGKAVDCVVTKNQVDFLQLGKTVLVLLLILLSSGFFQWCMALFTNRLTAGTIRSLRCDLFEHLQSLPISYIDKKSRGDLIGRAVSDMEIVSDGFLQAFTQFVTGIITILGTLIFMLTIHVKITIIVVLLTPLSLFVAAKLTNLAHNSYTEASKARGALSGITEEMLTAQDIVRLYGREQASEEAFAVHNLHLQKSGAKAVLFSSFSNPSTRFVNSVIYAAVGVCGAIAACNQIGFLGAITIGELTSFLTYANQYTKPFNEISGVVAELQNALSSARRIFDVLDEPAELKQNDLLKIPAENQDITLNNVSFSYQADAPFIENFSLHAAPGERIAIVGPTGCGKTTLINLLLRFYDITDGTIHIGNIDVQSLSRATVRNQFAMVLQDTWLFTGTIYENLSYYKPNATKEEIIHAAKNAHADSFIRRLPQGYNTIITENGAGLSQGQKQLLCIARCMLTNPPFLILDEATSNIDLRTEQRIQRSFQKLMQGKTCFIIAHRLSTVRNADQILVMQNGKIIEHGKHEELLAQDGFYKKLYYSSLQQ